MLRLESYLSPFLLSYLSKYIKDIEAKDLQLSIWGGDAVLHNLDFKLDALDNELGKAPFSFVSCHAQELRLHVPWSKLASESVVITLNTVECVVKLNCHKTFQKPSSVQKDETAVQPSYVSSLMKKIKNNLSVKVNNFILKYVEDDIVLSINFHSASYETVDELWQTAFVDLTESDLVIRRLLELNDVTVCLDKRGASGRVEFFEDPLLYRTRFIFREHNVYSSPSSSKPSVKKIHGKIDRYELNISENQLPAFIHLLQLSLHLYYGTIETSFEEKEDGTVNESTSPQPGWASWAWSYVPPVLSYEIEEHEPQATIFSFALYIKNIILQIKPSRSKSLKQFHSQSSKSKPLIEIAVEGFKMDVVAKGLEFFSCVTSLCKGNVKFLGGLPSTLNGELLQTSEGEVDVMLASGGRDLSGFTANSLFDFRSPENNGALFDYPLTKESFFTPNDEHKGDLFFSQYLYIASDSRVQSENDVEFSEYLRQAELTNIVEWSNIHEQSWKRFNIGSLSLQAQVSSHAMLCFDVLNAWSTNHSIKPYPLAPKQAVHTPEILHAVHFIPRRNSSFVFSNLTIVFPALCLAPKSYHAKNFASGSFSENDSLALAGKGTGNELLPAIAFSIPKAEFTIVQPMYGTHFAAYLSKYISPLPHLMNACNTQYQAQVPSVKVFLWHVPVLPLNPVALPASIQPILSFHSFGLESHKLQGKDYWAKRTTMHQNQVKAKLHMFTASATLNQLEILAHVVDSWIALMQNGKDCNDVLDISQTLEFLSKTNSSPALQFCANNLIVELDETFVTSSLGVAVRQFDLCWCLSNGIIPIMQCSNASKAMHSPEHFLKSESCEFARLQHSQVASWDDISHCFSFYLQTPNVSGNKGCVLLSIHQLFLNVDPSLLNKISTIPSISLRQLLPFLSSFGIANDNSEEKSGFLDKIKAAYALQLKFAGGQLFLSQKSHLCSLEIYNTQPALHIVQESILNLHSNVLIVALPKIIATTKGFKLMQIQHNLVSNGVMINPYIKFGTLDCGLEHATVFTVHTSGESKIVADYILKQCAATCTVALKQTTKARYSVALHVDFESIFVELSNVQICLLVEVLNSITQTLMSVKRNCKADSTFNALSSKLNIASSEKLLGSTLSKPTTGVTDAKTEEGTQAEVLGSNLTATMSLPIIVWMQCTLPSLVLTIHCEKSSKLAIFVDDVSMSLDYSLVYLKLMMSLSACNVNHWTNKIDELSKNDLAGLMFCPMFSVLPSFIENVSVAQMQSPLKEAEPVAKPGKFLELTYTKALTSDYQRNMQEGEADQTNSSVVSIAGEDVETQKPTVSEIVCNIQSFDLLMNPKPLEKVVRVFLPFFQLVTNTTNAVASNTLFDFPRLYITMEGARFFLPLEKFRDKLDDVVMLCVGQVEVHPQPQNKLGRLVVSKNIFKQAHAAGLLDTPGSSLEDKQFEIAFQDLHLGTTKSSCLVTHMKRPALLSENPALQWNMLGKSILDEPVFHPIIEQVGLKVLLAPSIYHTCNSGKILMVCAPSLEISIATTLILHLTIMQLSVAFDLVDLWATEQSKIATLFSKSNVSPDFYDKSLKDDCHAANIKLSYEQNTDIQQLTSESLFTGQKIKVLVYHFHDEDTLTPLLQLQIDEPSFAYHVSKSKQNVVLQLHNAFICVAPMNSSPVVTINEHKNFSVPVLETLAGECNKRTGVPHSLCTLTINDFLTNKTNLQLTFERPMKFLLNEDVVSCCNEVLVAVKDFQGLRKSSSQVSGLRSQKVHSVSLGLHLNYVACDLQNHGCRLRCSISEMDLSLESKLNIMTISVTATDLSAKLYFHDEHFPFLYPVTVKANAKAQFLSKWLFVIKTNLSSVHCVFSKDILNGIINLAQSLQDWNLNSLEIEGQNAPLITENVNLPKAFTFKMDDIRKGNYVYLDTEDLEPLPGQIVFSSKLPVSAMTWSYDMPHAIRHVSVTPIPFNDIVGDGSQDEILCTLESFCETDDTYVVQKEFFVSEMGYNEFCLFDENVPFYKQTFSTKWRVCVHNTTNCHISPRSLAASMNVEAVHNTAYVSNFVVSFIVDSFKVTFMNSNCGREMENAQLDVNGLHASLETWQGPKQCVKARANCSVGLQVVEYHCFTWIPVLLPVLTDVSLFREEKSLEMVCDIRKTLEINVSQRIVHSLNTFISNFFDHSSDASIFPLVIQNNTCSCILIGQALTDECIKLESGGKTTYFWRSNKVELKLHISIDGLPDRQWSSSFFPYLSENIVCEIDQAHCVIAKIEPLNAHVNHIVFTGCTRVFNYLDEDIQACFLVNGINVYSNCSAGCASQKDLLFHFNCSSTILFKLTNHDIEASEAIFASDFINSPECTKVIEFNSSSGQVVYAQVYCYKENLVDIVAVMPLFIVRSYLPNSVILHIEERSSKSSSSVLFHGRGSQMNLSSLSPFSTYHLTIQLNENEAPFDATIPLHFSMTNSLPNCSESVLKKEDLVQHFPYNSPNFKAKGDDDWSPGNGNIEGKLSLYYKSLLVELVPFCLVCNETSMVFCFTSTDKRITIVQPQQTTILHHFIGMFNIRTSNSSRSEWMTLAVSPELEHPSRAGKLKLNHLPYNGFQTVFLRTSSCLITVHLHSNVHSGVRVVTISPKWKFVNLSEKLKDVCVFPCVDKHFIQFHSAEDVVSGSFNAPAALLQWKIAIEPPINKPDNDSSDKIGSGSIESISEKTTSSFFCVEQMDASSTSNNRFLCITATDLQAVVSVGEDFTKKLVQFSSPLDCVLKKQLVITRHDFYGCSFLVLSDIKKKKFLFKNDTKKVLHLREVSDDDFCRIEVIIKPEEAAELDSFLDTELFPVCRKKCHTIRFEIRESTADCWTELLVSAEEKSEKIFLPDASYLNMTVLLKCGQVCVHFLENPGTEYHGELSQWGLESHLTIKEVKLVCLDDISNPLYSVDVVQMLFDDIDLKFFCRKQRWFAHFLLRQFQFDNQLYPASDFPIFLFSSSLENTCFSVLITLANNLALDKIEVNFDSAEVNSEGEFLLVLSKLLQSYLAFAHPDSEHEPETMQFPVEIMKEVQVLTNPLRFQSFFVSPVTLMLSVHASMAVSISVDRGAMSFSKFTCCDLDTTFHELVQELMRHYFADAIWGAGWVIGSVDLLGNPTSTLRSYVKGISDFVVMPYQGILNGPTAFVGGFTRGFASLLRHFSAGTLRSFTNIASGISRNLNYSQYEQHHNAQASQLLLSMGKRDEKLKRKSETSYVSGVTKILVGVVTKPIGGAAGLVSKTGETILRKIGLEEHKAVRCKSTSHTTSVYRNSVTKYSLKLISLDSTVFPCLLSSLDCCIIRSKNVKFSATLVLSNTTLYIFQLVDDVLETSFAISDIELHLEKLKDSDYFLLSLNSFQKSKEDVNYPNKVAEYLGVETFESNTAGRGNPVIKYKAEVELGPSAHLFLRVFKSLKQSSEKHKL